MQPEQARLRPPSLHGKLRMPRWRGTWQPGTRPPPTPPAPETERSDRRLRNRGRGRVLPETKSPARAAAQDAASKADIPQTCCPEEKVSAPSHRESDRERIPGRKETARESRRTRACLRRTRAELPVRILGANLFVERRRGSVFLVIAEHLPLAPRWDRG